MSSNRTLYNSNIIGCILKNRPISFYPSYNKRHLSDVNFALHRTSPQTVSLTTSKDSLQCHTGARRSGDITSMVRLSGPPIFAIRSVTDPCQTVMFLSTSSTFPFPCHPTSVSTMSIRHYAPRFFHRVLPHHMMRGLVSFYRAMH